MSKLQSLLREKQAIEYLSIGRNTFLSLKKKGKIKPVKFPGHRITRYKKEDLDNFIESLGECTSNLKEESEKTERPENTPKTSITPPSSGSPVVMSFQEALKKRPIVRPKHGPNERLPELSKTNSSIK